MELMEIPGEIKILLLIPSGKKKGDRKMKTPSCTTLLFHLTVFIK